MTPLLAVINKSQPAALPSNSAVSQEPDAGLQDYAALIAGLTQQTTPLAAADDTALSDSDAALLTAADQAAAVVVAELTEATTSSQQSLHSSQSDSMNAAMQLSYSFGAERSVFYSTMQTGVTPDLSGGHGLSHSITATVTEPAAVQQSIVQAAEQRLTVLPAAQHAASLHQALSPQNTSLPPLLWQAVNIEQQDNPAAVSGPLASATATGSSAQAAEPLTHWKADLTGLQSSQWGQKLVHLLSDKINVQLGQQIQRAQIRLDPPQLGVIELSVSVDGDRTSVQLYAANSQLREAMQQHLDQLRQQLTQRFGAEHSLELDVRDQAQQQTKHHQSAVQTIASQQGSEEAELNTAASQQGTGWLDRLV
ncbi:flagellar hook-length control protein FliK [Alkalimonas mucilaginosa]|uniref:Flagellar hook-length control protein FliK n=1 Tax=Alkalimonas mucilaginosa TaxID=3057676 RepID=A0ABU7JEH9_9GAMM|nr:flagellar hook-length control protein FliK [Alkalimonas sp. MEB004]MEE2024045.1 flagellar hook-length control protein FliK [Alkalimonas sp. MEB004]